MKSSSMRFFLGPRKNGKGSIGFGSPALLRVRAEPEAREGFLGEKPSDTMFEAFYKTAMSVRAPSRAPGSEALPRRTRAAPTTKYTRTPSNESDRDRPVPRLLSSRSARACTSPSSSPARSWAKRYVTPPPVPDRTFPPRGRAAVVSHGTAWRERSIIEKKSRRSPTPRLAALVSLTPPLPNAQVVNNGFDAMWESRNKGKLFKDMTIPEPSEE